MSDKSVDKILQDCFSVDYAITGGSTYNIYYRRVAEAKTQLRELVMSVLPKKSYEGCSIKTLGHGCNCSLCARDLAIIETTKAIAEVLK